MMLKVGAGLVLILLASLISLRTYYAGSCSPPCTGTLECCATRDRPNACCVSVSEETHATKYRVTHARATCNPQRATNGSIAPLGNTGKCANGLRGFTFLFVGASIMLIITLWAFNLEAQVLFRYGHGASLSVSRGDGEPRRHDERNADRAYLRPVGERLFAASFKWR